MSLLAKIGKESFLDREEEKFLLEKAKNGDKEAKEKIIRASFPLVTFWARKIKSKYKNVDMNDLEQEGVLGLLGAFENYDIKRINEIKFATYANFKVKEAIKTSAQRQCSAFPQPAHISTLYGKIREYETKHFQEHLVRLSSVNIARKLDVTEDCVERAKNFYQPVVSLQEVICNDSKTSRQELIMDNGESLEDSALDGMLRKEVKELVGILGEPSATYVRMRFGIDCVPLTFGDIADRFGVTGESVRKDIMKSMKRMKKMPEFKKLASQL